ncbi:PHP domain-containing protein [Desulfovibrionales bacterium]
MSEIDLHTHTTASDGTCTPSELVSQAVAVGLRAIAVTDHDTLQGLPEACAAGKDKGLEVIPGCELSVEFPQGSMHILGLWIPARPKHLQDTLDYLTKLRQQRNETILANLHAAGVPITYAELTATATGTTIGRPHIAQLLVRKGVARDLPDAFINWLRPGTKGYAPKAKLAPRDAILALKNEGATVILAHPCTLKQDHADLEETIKKLKDMGLDGVESIYSMHSQAQTNAYAAICKKLGLLESAGSDFHGTNKPNIHLGRGKGGLRASYVLLERMKAYRQGLGLPAHI